MLTSAAMRAVCPHICRHPSPATSCQSEAPYIASCENEVPLITLGALSATRLHHAADRAVCRPWDWTARNTRAPRSTLLMPQ